MISKMACTLSLFAVTTISHANEKHVDASVFSRCVAGYYVLSDIYESSGQTEKMYEANAEYQVFYSAAEVPMWAMDMSFVSASETSYKLINHFKHEWQDKNTYQKTLTPDDFIALRQTCDAYKEKAKYYISTKQYYYDTKKP